MKKNHWLVCTPLFITLSLCSCGTNTKSSVSEDNSGEQGSSSSIIEEEKLPLNPLTPVYSYTFPSLEKGVMPIGAWCAPWHVNDTNFITLQQFQYIKEAGLNSIYGLYERMGVNDPYVYDSLSLADQVGISYLVRDDSLNARADDVDDFKARMDTFTEHPSFAGILMRDEPGKASFQSLSTSRKLFRQYYTKYAYYVNAFPTYARGQQLSGDETEIDYDEYLDSLLKTISPQMLSFDYYGLRKTSPNIADGYFEQIYISKQYADKYKVPFWPFIQTCKFENNTRVPSATDIYWQVGANLVFGAKAIQYFCYFAPYEEQDWQGNLIDASGKRTEVYYYCQTVNKFIAEVDEILMKSTLVDMMQYGNTPAPMPEELSFVTSSREIQSVETASNVLIGVFNHDGKTALYVFNNDLENDANVKINFVTKVDADIYEFSKKESVAGTNDVLIDLRPGTSALVDLTNY